MPGSQGDSPSSKRSYGKDTLRPVTIKQLNDAHHPHPDAEYFMIDNTEATQVTFIGQIRNISTQTTNVTYKLDDGTSTIEVKQWIDSDAFNNPDDPSNQKPKLTENQYARVWGRLKVFGSKRHVGANIIRPVQDYNEIAYHLLEATVVHLHFTRGPPGGEQANGGAVANGNGQQQNGQTTFPGEKPMPTSASSAARRMYEVIKTTPQTNEGLHMQDVAHRANMEVSDVLKASEELMSMGLIYTTVDDHTWAILDV